MISPPTPDELRQRLTELRAARGYLLPHHGAMAAAAPDLHAAYLTMYKAVTLTRRHLDDFTKEFVWLAILTTMREAVGTHHLELFQRAGGTDDQACLAFQLAGYAEAGDCFGFVDQHWRAFFAGVDAEARYLAGAEALRQDRVTAEAAALALLACHAAKGRHWGIATHLKAAYREGFDEDRLVEALTLVIWPTGVNRFLEACTIWHDLMAAGAVTPSPRYQAWADTPSQGGYERGAPGLT